MTQEERAIYNFMKATPEVFYSVREIARRIARPEERQELTNSLPDILQRMVKRGTLESDNRGHYRMKPTPEIESAGRRWVSPQMARLLRESKNDFSKIATTEIRESDFEDNL